jgi:hypothetical protein
MGQKSRTTRAVIIGMVVALSGLGLAAPAVAATTWVRSTAPNPSPTTNLLRAVSCVSATACTAVGFRDGAGGAFDFLSLIERTTDGVHWSVVPTPKPAAGWTGNELHGVSCTSATSCTAVGRASNPASAFPSSPLVLRTTDGTTWSRVVAPSSGAPSQLLGVSCATALSCTAVGQVGTKTLILQTNDGASWVRRRSPNPGVGLNLLNGVSCVSAVSCTAVGYFSQGDEAAPRRTLVLRTTDGVSWTRVKTPNPSPDPGLNQLSDVSCSGPSTCVAVGLVTRDASTVKRALVLRTTDGLTWTRLTTTPITTGEIDLFGVSCSAPTVCTAVGVEKPDGDPVRAPFIAQTTNGIAWTEVPSPNPGGAARPLAVSCSAVDHCYAVGDWVGSRPTPQLRALVLKET